VRYDLSVTVSGWFSPQNGIASGSPQDKVDKYFRASSKCTQAQFFSPGAEPRVLRLEAESDADAAWKSGRFHVAAWLEIISSRGLRSAEID
jgi:hypothetical protein